MWVQIVWLFDKKNHISDEFSNWDLLKSNFVVTIFLASGYDIQSLKKVSWIHFLQANKNHVIRPQKYVLMLLRRYFYPLCQIYQILSAIFFFKNFQTFLDVKIDIIQVILTPCPVH